MTILVIDADKVRTLLPMSACIDSMASAMIAASSERVTAPPRMITPLQSADDLLLVMPGSSSELSTYGAKIISLHPNNPANGHPAIQGYILLFDRQSGTPVALIDGAEITTLRTAAVSGLATKLLAREQASSCGIFGTGVQAVSHIDAMCAVRPIERINIWARDIDKATEFAKVQSLRTGKEVIAVINPEDAAACDVICTVTGSKNPILKGEWLSEGAHINLVGAHSLTTREADTEAIKKSAVYIDLMESLRNEGGDIMIPIKEGVIDEGHIVGEMGDLLTSKISGRTDDRQITLYNSLGITAQDLFAAEAVYANAKAE